MTTCMGIDYGSKMAGTTCICITESNVTTIFQSKKKQNADVFILDIVRDLRPTIIGIDAPLSLPAAYFEKSPTMVSNFFFRESDIELKAMSPMFLGGLTARAAKLKVEIQHLLPETTIIEVYPKAMVEYHMNKTFYNKKKDNIEKFVQSNDSWFPDFPFKNWHQVDSCIALRTVERFRDKKASAFGRPDEGSIWV